MASVCMERMIVEIVGHFRDVGQQLGDPSACLAMLLEFEDRRRDREAALSRGHGRQALTLANGLGQVLVVPVLHLRLVVEEVHLRRGADHVQIDRALDLRLENEAIGRGARAAASPNILREGGCAQAPCASGEKLASRFVRTA